MLGRNTGHQSILANEQDEKDDINVILQQLQATRDAIHFLDELSKDNINRSLKHKSQWPALVSYLYLTILSPYPTNFNELNDKQQKKLANFVSIASPNDCKELITKADNHYTSLDDYDPYCSAFPLSRILDILEKHKEKLEICPQLNQQRIHSFLLGKLTQRNSAISQSFFHHKKLFEPNVLGLITENLTGIQVVQDGYKRKRP